MQPIVVLRVFEQAFPVQPVVPLMIDPSTEPRPPLPVEALVHCDAKEHLLEFADRLTQLALVLAGDLCEVRDLDPFSMGVLRQKMGRESSELSPAFLGPSCLHERGGLCSLENLPGG